jgi:hypothetical protein
VYKQLIVLILLSIIAVFFKTQLGYILHLLSWLHQQFTYGLGTSLGNGLLARKIQAILALLIPPLFIGLLVGFFSYIFKRRITPYLMTVVWIVWIILLIIMLRVICTPI